MICSNIKLTGPARVQSNWRCRRFHAVESKGFNDGRATQAGNPGGCRQVRRLLRLQRHREAGFQRRQGPRLDRARHGHLPFLRAGRPLHLAAEDPAHQRLQLRLPLLRQPRLQQRAAGALHRRRGREAHARLLSPQLHRGPVPLLRHHPQRRLHHGAGGRASRARCARSITSAATSISRPFPRPTTR